MSRSSFTTGYISKQTTGNSASKHIGTITMVKTLE